MKHNFNPRRSFAALAAALALSLLLGSCSGGHLMDVHDFADSFNSRCKALKIDTSSLFSTETENGRKFDILLSPSEEYSGTKILLTLFCGEQGSVTELCLTIAALPTATDLAADADLTARLFSLAAHTCAEVFTVGSGENSKQTLDSLGLSDMNVLSSGKTVYKETHRFGYYLTTNAVGAQLGIQSKRLTPSDGEALTLREEQTSSD